MESQWLQCFSGKKSALYLLRLIDYFAFHCIINPNKVYSFMNPKNRLFWLSAILLLFSTFTHAQERDRVRDLGINPGILPTGEWNAITDVDGVMVGHKTLIEGDNIRTGVTAILPHGGNLFRERVPAAVYVGNGFGKALGFTQVRELGELETPIALTNTLSIFDVAKGVADYVLNQPGNENVGSVNPVVGETNDGWLNEIRARVIDTEDVYEAIGIAETGPVTEGNVGAGTGTRALGFKGGIGTSSRQLPDDQGGYTVGVLVQSNFGGILTVNGAPVGEELGNHYLASHPTTPSDRMTELVAENTRQTTPNGQTGEMYAAKKSGLAANEIADNGDYDYDLDGSVMIVVATDAPLTSRNLERLAKRAFLGISRVGGFASNGSGDYVIAFSSHPDVRNNLDNSGSVREIRELDNSAVSPLFLAAVEATEEAILNSLFMAETMEGYESRIQEALPVDEVMDILKRYRADQ